MISEIRDVLLRERQRILDRLAAERAHPIIAEDMVVALECDLLHVQKSLNDTSGVSGFLASRRAKR